VVEVNFGGDMATEVVKQTAERVHQRGGRDTNMIRVKEVSASRGKAMRAEPISLLYEKGRVLHRRGLDQLEAEMMAFSRPRGRWLAQPARRNDLGNHSAEQNYHANPNRLIVRTGSACGAIEIRFSELRPPAN
jgi:phage terminase large subunit-like protein